jgi:hypothetical protein
MPDNIVTCKKDDADSDMAKIMRAVSMLNAWRLRMKKEYIMEDWHLVAALGSFCTAMDAIMACTPDDTDDNNVDTNNDEV